MRSIALMDEFMRRFMNAVMIVGGVLFSALPFLGAEEVNWMMADKAQVRNATRGYECNADGSQRYCDIAEQVWMDLSGEIGSSEKLLLSLKDTPLGFSAHARLEKGGEVIAELNMDLSMVDHFGPIPDENVRRFFSRLLADLLIERGL